MATSSSAFRPEPDVLKDSQIQHFYTSEYWSSSHL